VLATERIGKGPLRTGLFESLHRWGALDEDERARVARLAEESARSLAFARSVADRFPKGAGCLAAVVACLAVWSAFLWEPEVRDMVRGGVTLAAGLGAGAAVSHGLMRRRARRWTREILIPEGRREGIDFGRFVAVLEDLPPPGPRMFGELDDLREQSSAIRAELAASGLIEAGEASPQTASRG
jgi:hypothetical protein